MQRLSAIDAIAPAFTHTSRLLFENRNWRVLLKISAVAFFAQMGGCNLNFNAPGRFPHSASPAAATGLLAIIFFVGLAVFLVGLILFYVGSRLQFVLFDVVLRQFTRIGPVWSRYGRVVWRWIGLKVLFFLAALVAMLPVLVPLVIHVIRSMPATSDANPLAFITSLLGFIGLILVIVIFLSVCYILIADFGLPSLALENVPISEALRRVWFFVRQEPGPIALYILMRFLLGLACALCAYVLIFLVTFLLLIPLGGVAIALYLALRHAGTGAHIAMIGGWIVLAVVLALAIVLVILVCFGACFTFLQAYALYFLAGRYPLLASILEPGPGAPFTPPPVFPSPEETPDDDNPPFPMDPALA